MFRDVSSIMSDLLSSKLSHAPWSTHGRSCALSAEALLDTIAEIAPGAGDVLRWLMIQDDEAGFLKLQEEISRRRLPYELYQTVSVEGAELFLRKVRFDLVVVAESLEPVACANLRASAGETPVIFWAPNAGWNAPERLTEANTPSNERLVFYLPIGVCLFASDGRWLAVSPGFSEVLGYTAAELTGTDFQAIAHPADVEKEDRLICQLIEGQIERYEIEKRYLHKNGNIVWAFLEVALMKNDQDRAGDFLVNVRLLAHEIDAMREASDGRLSYAESQSGVVGKIARAK